MKQFSLIIFLLTFSIAGHTASNKGKKSLERPGLVEKRQNKAREILNNNFNVLDRVKEKGDEKPNFGFKKAEKKNKQSL